MKTKKKIITEHEQIPFQLTDGKWVEVDRGLLEVLQELQRLGVRTQYSCQGGEMENQASAAYILADRRTFGPVLRKVYKNYLFGRYSNESRDVIRGFLAGHRTREVVLRGFNRNLYFRLSKNQKQYGGYEIEQELTSKFGFRTCVRWPYEFTDLVLKLLRETK